MVVVAPPGMQPWVRGVDEKLRALERAKQPSGASTRRAVRAVNDNILESPAGVSDRWMTMPVQSGPDVIVTTATGLIRVTLTCRMEGVRITNTLVAGAMGAMSFSMDQETAYSTPEYGEPRALTNTFVIAASLLVEAVTTASISRTLPVPNGTYTLRSEYMYKHFTDNMIIRWSYRELLAEPI